MIVGIPIRATVQGTLQPNTRVVRPIWLVALFAIVVAFTDEDDVLARANGTEYGLVAYVFTRDVGRVLRVSEALQFGMVGINTGIVSNPAAPFGGVKHSGFGREGGFEGIEEYLETKYVGSAL